LIDQAPQNRCGIADQRDLAFVAARAHPRRRRRTIANSVNAPLSYRIEDRVPTASTHRSVSIVCTVPRQRHANDCGMSTPRR
jgi:hypothetical protein